MNCFIVVIIFIFYEFETLLVMNQLLTISESINWMSQQNHGLVDGTLNTYLLQTEETPPKAAYWLETKLHPNTLVVLWAQRPVFKFS